MTTPDVAMQARCPSCRAEQYAPAVYPISMGEHPCVWCGVQGRKMTKAEYQAAMDEFYAAHP